MKRIDNATAVASLPTYASGTDPDRYFTDGTPGVSDGTIPGQDWFNMVQEEISNAITDDGDSLDGADDTQLAQRLTPLKGLRTSTTTASGPTTHDRVVIASGTEYASASGDASAVVACDGLPIASGAASAVVASTGAVTASGDASAVVACGGTGAVVSGDVAVVVASTNVVVEKDNAAAIACYDSRITATASSTSVLLAGGRCELTSPSTIAAGYHATTTPTWADTDQNLTFRVSVTTGNVTADGSFTGGGADYAEYYEAADHAAPPPVGALVTREGTRVRLATAGDRVLGPVSATAAVVGNAAALSWAGRFATDEWGRRVTREYDGGQVWYVESPDYDPAAPYIPRSERPEWVPVGLLGQVRVRVDASVSAGDDVTAGHRPGVGTRGEGRGRPVVCVAVEVAYDAARGYAIALCDVG